MIVVTLVMLYSLVFDNTSADAQTAAATTSSGAPPEQPPEQPPALVTTTLAQAGASAAQVWLPGTVVSSRDARVAAEQSARVIWIAELGSMIEAGQSMARLDDRELQLQKANHLSQVESLAAQLNYQESQLQRLQSLSKENSVAASQVDETSAQVVMMRQQLAQAKITLKQTELQLSRTNIQAPFSGQLVSRMVQIGEHVSAGSVIARLVDIGNREIRVQVPVTMVAGVGQQSAVMIRNQQGERQDRVKAILAVADEASRMVEMRVHASDPMWQIGSAVQVALQSSDSLPDVTIPRDALVLRGERQFVYRIDSEGNPEQVDVATGVGLGNLVEVIGGIQAGDEIILRGAERLRPGQTVQIVDSESGIS